MSNEKIERKLDVVLKKYQSSFSSKVIDTNSGYEDILMNVFCITPDMKLKNMQYWGRELGKCWEKIIQEVLSTTCDDYQGPLFRGLDEICDCIVGKYAIDVKYRVGSGDSGTLKKFKEYGKYLKDNDYIPTMLFLREDNLENALTAIRTGQWEYIMGDESFEFIKKISGFDLKESLESKIGKYKLSSITQKSLSDIS
jgi:hypothetical protein